MDFDFTDDQLMLRDTVRKWVDKDYPFENRRKLASTRGFSSKAWQGLANLGLLGLLIPQEQGGMGLGSIEAMVVMEELGRGLVVEPYAQGALIATHILAFAPASIRERCLPAIAAGEMLVVLAHQEHAARYRLNHITTRATCSAHSWRLSGAKAVVPAGSHAHALIVPARVEGSDGDAEGVALFLVQRDGAGVEVRSHPAQDGSAVAEVKFTNAAAELIVGAGAGPIDPFGVFESAVDVGIAALCAEAVGAMQALLGITVEYMNTRKQFGVPIASFQALRHRMADIKLQLELARSMSYLASMKLADEPGVRRRVLSQAKLQLGRSMRFVGQQSLQLHGGIGLTDEYMASHYFKRLTVIEMSFGDTMHHLGEVSTRMEATAGVY